MTEPCLLPVGQAARAIAERRLTARALVESCLARIARLDPIVGAWVAVDADRSLVAAERADREIEAGRRRGPLHGIPYGLKDILRTAELPTRAASRLPLADDGAEAAVHCRLRDAGAILIGKLNTYEFGTGTGAVYDDLPAPVARNPWNPDHFTGGSSTGAGAAVAAGMVPLAIGTDTGGSVRLPAMACGLVGLKPTYDLIPRTGMLPNCPSQDHLGPLTRTVADAALALAATTGTESVPGSGRLDGLRVAVVRSFHDGDPVADPAVAEHFESAVGILRGLGAETVDRRVGPSLRDFRACGRIVNAGESFAIHRRWLDDPSTAIGTALRDKLEAAAGLTASDYLDAQRWRRALVEALVEAMAGCDLMLCAGTMTPAPRLDDEAGCVRFTGDSAMTPFSLSGQPALVLPTGLDPAGLPIGVQLAARPFAEAVLLCAGAALEAAIGFAGVVPPDPVRPASACARPPAAPARAGRAGRLARSMAESVARIPRPLADELGSVLSFKPTELWT
ncbi:glutamyl-tRNA(Gln) amidotransferase [Thalassobaculum fulvum]|uniref:Glutamyl-tRNA(Gln) amidotransferase n=1 Tax=Thalassobaculum fulvum TaxID=1633335 RepID=A0A918XXW3_9PROT|nr:amidase [Thalassobaculum fulvum]GHD62296.1 glutamyl-tRNA(Gln) amidotransferase [Thalassobaculum fulvum]